MKKGEKKVEIAGKEIKLRFDLNALDSFCETNDVGLDELDSALNKPSKIKSFIQCLAISGGSEISLDEIGSLALDELHNVFEIVKESTGNLKAPKGAKK